ncbi:MAG TPA: hybrid sensor histidine kinase/response regulator [Gemmatimonadales bacterium]
MTEPAGGAAPARRGRVLVVDDHESNRALLRELLEIDGHDVLEAEDGLGALALARSEDPDVVLLDVTMPGLDGFEVCRRLRASPVTSATPVLLITGLAERAHRIAGVAAGANDYLVKPIDRGEVALRVRNALRMREMHRAIDHQYRALQQLEQLREDLVAMIAHDLRSPLTGLRGFLEMLEADPARNLSAPMEALLGDAVRSVDRMNGMIGDMLDVSRMESAALPLHIDAVSLSDLARRAVAVIGPAPDFHVVTIVVDGSDQPVNCDAGLVQRVLVNLLANAVRFSPSRGVVTVLVARDDQRATVRVRDRGPGIAADDQARIFEKFRQGGTASGHLARSSGLGLTFCRMVVELHGGEIGVASDLGQGSEFWFTLPQ